MIRKVCPICEQTMSLPHYCKNCRQFVKSPYVRDITYYLNESHPEGEKDCDYNNVHRGRESRKAKDMGRRAGRTIREHTGMGRKRIWLAFLGIYVVIQLIGAVGSVVAKRYVQADRDVFIVPRVVCNRLDPSCVDGMSDKMCIDATSAPGERERRVTLPEAVRARAADLLNGKENAR